ncbi:ANKRD50, partial [Symbiodinium microadriaticum]
VEKAVRGLALPELIDVSVNLLSESATVVLRSDADLSSAVEAIRQAIVSKGLQATVTKMPARRSEASSNVLQLEAWLFVSLVEKSNVAGDLFDAIYKKTGLSHEDGDYSLTFGTEEGASSLMACDGFDAYLMEGQDLTLKIQAVSLGKDRDFQIGSGAGIPRDQPSASEYHRYA